MMAIPDPRETSLHCRKSPSLDHLVGAGEQLRRHSEAERLGRFKIDHQLNFGALLDREDFSGVTPHLPS